MIKNRRPAPAIRCVAIDYFGCPGGASGDEFAPKMGTRCRDAAEFVAKHVDQVDGRVKVKVCQGHAPSYVEEGARVYRVRTI